METIKLNNGLDCPVAGKGARYYKRTDAQLEQFAAWHPSYEK